MHLFWVKILHCTYLLSCKLLINVLTLAQLFSTSSLCLSHSHPMTLCACYIPYFSSVHFHTRHRQHNDMYTITIMKKTAKSLILKVFPYSKNLGIIGLESQGAWEIKSPFLSTPDLLIILYL